MGATTICNNVALTQASYQRTSHKS